MLRMLADHALARKILDGMLQTRPGEEFVHPVVDGRGAGVAAHRAVVKSSDEFGLNCQIGTDPESTSSPDLALLQCAPLIVSVDDRQLGEQFLRVGVGLVGIGDFLKPLWLANGQCIKLY